MPAATLDRPLLRARPEDLVGKSFEFIADLNTEDGRVEMYEAPQPRQQYVLGLDFALGIPGRDWDTGCIFRRTKQPPYPQVFEMQGHWGPDFDRLIYAAATFYNGAFVLGEANNTGNSVLRRLYDDYAYHFLYGDRDETKKGRKNLGRLGCWKGTGAIVLPKFRRAVRDLAVLIRSRPLLQQMRKIQYKAKSSVEPQAATDDDLRVKVAGGGSPDLVMAAAYAYHAIEEVGYFEEPEPVAPPGSLGDVLGHNEDQGGVVKGTVWVPQRGNRKK